MDIDADLFQLFFAAFGEFRRKCSEYAVGTFEQGYAGFCGIYGLEVPVQRLAGNIGNCTGKFNAGRPASDYHKIQDWHAAVQVRFAFGHLEREKNTSPHLDGIFDRL